MLRKYWYLLVIVTSLVLGNLNPASGYSRDWRPFIVRKDLAPVKRERETVRLPAARFEEYRPDIKDLSNVLKLGDEGGGKSWSEFQFGSFRFRFSRYHDFLPPTNSIESNKTDNTWEMVKSLPAQLGGSPNRATLEAMGKIFTPHLDLGIEF